MSKGEALGKNILHHSRKLSILLKQESFFSLEQTMMGIFRVVLEHSMLKLFGSALKFNVDILATLTIFTKRAR
jgi:hypothetical protein